MAAGMIKIFLVFIGIFILSTLTMICFYFYNKSKEKKTNYLKALIGSLVGLIASLIGLTLCRFNQNNFNYIYSKFQDEYLIELNKNVFFTGSSDYGLLFLLCVIIFIIFFYIGSRKN
ncbi:MULTISPECIES: hypothetical protein [Bacillus]|nr:MULTISPECIES: hypothetical protein [Bacillus]AJA23735.1 hypothetical protein BT4G5_33400 [Bacillus thuringiensis serovar galleriae]ARP61858.1 hypothetical protein CAB88_32885 [Bacillus thuringiensis]EEM25706.1 hypothetical protein bthur0002_54550 [Bacillus thuringiensis Bt407]EEM31923.1 hypothetical protein bthur0003_55780 [Bacillus thuringiensis serovar thuringiensis str. T01001]EEM63046.1 hypothetical protein bthur0008_53610 [Bacillus thuringiensis serovar berliner ATCC 10792]